MLAAARQAIHEAQVAEHGGAVGIRDAGLLEFFRLNGFRPTASNADCVVHVLALAAGEPTDEQFTAWVRSHATR